MNNKLPQPIINIVRSYTLPSENDIKKNRKNNLNLLTLEISQIHYRFETNLWFDLKTLTYNDDFSLTKIGKSYKNIFLRWDIVSI